MAESIQENGTTTLCTAVASSHGSTVEFMRVNTKTTSKRAKVASNGRTDVSTWASGRMANNMARAGTHLLLEQKGKVSGRMGSACTGYLESLLVDYPCQPE